MSRLIDLDALLDELADRIATRLRAESPPHTAPTEPGYLTTGATGKRTSLSSEFWRGLAERGEIPARRVGRRYLLLWEDVQRYLDRDKPPPMKRPPSADELLAHGNELLARRAKRGGQP